MQGCINFQEAPKIKFSSNGAKNLYFIGVGAKNCYLIGVGARNCLFMGPKINKWLCFFCFRARGHKLRAGGHKLTFLAIYSPLGPKGKSTLSRPVQQANLPIPPHTPNKSQSRGQFFLVPPIPLLSEPDGGVGGGQVQRHLPEVQGHQSRG